MRAKALHHSILKITTTSKRGREDIIVKLLNDREEACIIADVHRVGRSALQHPMVCKIVLDELD